MAVHQVVSPRAKKVDGGKEWDFLKDAYGRQVYETTEEMLARYEAAGVEVEGPLANHYGDIFYRTVQYRGLVLADRERNFYHDSDFYAVVWDEEKGDTFQVEYATTRFSTYDNRCSVDATDEVRAKYQALQAKREQDRRDEFAVNRAFSHCITIEKGREVEVFKGRKVKVGTVGRVFWIGNSQYGLRLGIATSDRKNSRGGNKDVAWVAEGNCRVLNPAQYLGDKELEYDLRDRKDLVERTVAKLQEYYGVPISTKTTVALTKTQRKALEGRDGARVKCHVRTANAMRTKGLGSVLREKNGDTFLLLNAKGTRLAEQLGF